jgi:selenocysteine lyase/cysteine desulfurase
VEVIPKEKVGHEESSTTVRKMLGHLPNAESTIAIMPSTAFAVTLAARNIQRLLAEKQKQQLEEEEDVGSSAANGTRRFRILVLQDQFDSAIYPWQQICKESNGLIRLEVVEHPTEYDGWTRSILEKLSSSSSSDDNGNTSNDPFLAACLPPLHWSDGSIIDLKVIGSVCRKQKIPLIVDATQAVGIMPIQVYKIRPAMLVASTHKWLRGPSGTCLAYIEPSVYDSWMPLDFHGRGRDFMAGAESWDASKNEMSPEGYPDTFYKDARKFDSGGKVDAIRMPMLKASMEAVAQLDLKQAQQSLKTLMEPLLNWVKQQQQGADDKADGKYAVGPGPRAHHIIGLVALNKTPTEMIQMARKLQEEYGVVVAVRCGGFRISPYLNNTPDDVSKLIEALEEVGHHPFSDVVSTTIDL